MDVGVEQLLAVEADTVRHADVAHVTATASALDRLHHRLLRTDTLQHRVRTDSIGQLLDSLHTFITALRHDIGDRKSTRLNSSHSSTLFPYTTLFRSVGVEQLLAVEADTVRHADVAHVTATASALDRLHHRLLRTDTLQHRVRTDSIGQLLDSLHTFITALRHDI